MKIINIIHIKFHLAQYISSIVKICSPNLAHMHKNTFIFLLRPLELDSLLQQRYFFPFRLPQTQLKQDHTSSGRSAS